MSTSPPSYAESDMHRRRIESDADRQQSEDALPPQAAEPASPNRATGLAQDSRLLDKSGAGFDGSGAQQADAALRLQRRMGNQYVQRVLSRLRRSRRKRDEASLEAPEALQRLPARTPLIQRASQGLRVQRDLAGSFPTSTGGFEMAMITKTGAVAGTGNSGLSGTIKFLPQKGAPYSNKIGLVQIVKLTDAGGANVAPVSLPATHAPHLRTTADPKAGVEGGFFTDILHHDPFTTKKTAAPGSQTAPYYPFSSGGAQIFGFKRSDDPADIKPAELFDFPGTSSKTSNLDFSFETVAKGDDSLVVYGAVKWSFGLRAGAVVSEKMSVSDTVSPTFAAALEKHRDFYVHEPVAFYFDFDSDALGGAESGKIGTFLSYLARFPDVRLSLEGFADQRGNPAYNRDLAMRRSRAVRTALIAAGVDAGRINAPTTAGATTGFTKDATTAQDEEANRRGNRRVTLTFEHTATPAPKGP